MGIAGQEALDLGTGTGVLPRNMYHYGAKWTGTDISENQITYAQKLRRGSLDKLIDELARGKTMEKILRK